jgi:hypothetical protein
MADAAEWAGVRRFVQVSWGPAGRRGPVPVEVWAASITAKTAAVADPVPAGTVPRADVAAVIATLLDEPGTRYQTLELVGGDSPVAATVHSIS